MGQQMTEQQPERRLAAIRAEGAKLAPWAIDVEITPGLTTGDLRPESDRHGAFPDPAPGLRDLFSKLYPEGLQGRSVCDFACNNGAFMFALKDIGAGRCYGSDVRDHWITQARFLAKHREGPSDGMIFEVADLYDLPEIEPCDIGIFSGIFYHLPDPIRGLQILADHTKEVLYLSTAAQSNVRHDLLVAVEESTTMELSGVHELAFFPTGPTVLRKMLKWMGFPAVRCLNWWNPPDSEADSIQMMAARDQRLIDRLGRPKGIAGLLIHIQETVRPGATVVVLRTDRSKTLEVPQRTTVDFPAPHPHAYPPTTRDLCVQLDGLRAAGAECLAVPNSAFAWLADRPELQSLLDVRYPALRDASCILYDLRD